MGESTLRKRLAVERILLERMAPRFRSANGMADRRLQVRALDFALRVSGLAGRARRNFEQIRLVRKKWEIEGLDRDLSGLRILHVSDFHLDFDPGLLSRLREALRGVEYDLACLTGDFFDLIFEEDSIKAQWLDDLIGLFRGPVFAVLGNHDILAVADHLERLGVSVLMNEGQPFGPNGRGLWIAGVDDPRLFESDSMESALRGRPPGAPVLLLAHSPQAYQEASLHNVDFMMSGHTHGGQVSLPWFVPFTSRFRCPQRMASGAWRHGRLQGYTSNGCGGSKLAYRLNAPAEIALHTIFPHS